MYRSRRVPRLLALAVSAFTLAGCAASIRVNSYAERGIDFARYRTYWDATDRQATGDPRLDNNPFFHDRIRADVDRLLAARGLEKVTPPAADLLIHVHASIYQRVDPNRADQSFGYSAADQYGNSDDRRPFVYDAGTLVLDFVDMRTNKVVWRGWGGGQPGRGHRQSDVDGAEDRRHRRSNPDTAAARLLGSCLLPERRGTAWVSERKMGTLTRKQLPAPSGGNRLLDSLPNSEQARLARYLAQVPLSPKQVVSRQGQPIDRLYFPDSGVISLSWVTREGKSVGVGVVGTEGVVGVHGMYADTLMPCEASVVVAGAARVVKAADLRREMTRGGELAEILRRYSQALLIQTMQTGACNTLHSTRQRTARWILGIQERTGQTRFPLTQELLALMLGVRRPTVSVVARDLRRSGLIDYRHGRMTILDRRRLEAAACECNRIAKDYIARLLRAEREQNFGSPLDLLLALA